MTHVFNDAVRHFWLTRESQTVRQAEAGGVDQGSRAAVTGGRQMNGFARVIAEKLRAIGVPEGEIFTIRGKTIPGFYRPSKDWDLLVVSKQRLLVAVELKSHIGPSFGNNFNNRAEEAIGTAVDLWTAYRESAFQTSPRPWLGYLALVEDCEASRRPVRITEEHFKVRPEFLTSSYTQRYVTLCRSLVLERQYDSACLLLADLGAATLEDNYVEPAEDLGAEQFLKALTQHVQATL